ncbi:Sensor protein vraS [Alloiococcus otitis]|uniref:Sensor histidine kinase n=1 Tax=Alloiococcus otitis ATCC 51267 TaxID=883081 RepID=K9EY36_9LACT|nr:sensor histidine kinase [Alloiococcus otitis]EKU94150.1 hypothetical protein HMPREF9698_00182 [Alloiococcus otitis ATCC 51267]SUU81217.1 Sensor protein vraS [Alloiococcus otitis]
MKDHIKRLILTNILVIIILILAIAVTLRYFTEYSLVGLVIDDYYSFPYLMVLLIFSFILTLAFYGIPTLLKYRRDRKIEQALKSLIEGNYSSNLIARMTYAPKAQISPKIDQAFLQLQKKLISISNEILLTKEEQAQLGTETREEILEAERKRIARELHDSVSQHLFASSMILSAINEQDLLAQDYPAISQQLANVEQIINNSQLEMRALLLHLRPVQLNNKSLKEGISHLLKELASKVKMAIKQDLDEVTLPTSIEDDLFRVVQELLSNVLRHSQAEEVEVYLKERPQKIVLRVVDDGLGFDLDEDRSGSYGLANIEERISGMGGNVKIVSLKNQGTSVEITIPIDLEEAND